MNLWLARISLDDGTLVSEMIFPGRNGTIANLGSDWIVVHDRFTSGIKSNFAATRLTADFERTWTTPIPVSPMTAFHNRLLVTKDGRILVVGDAPTQVRFIELDAEGQMLNITRTPNFDPFSPRHFEIVDDMIVVALEDYEDSKFTAGLAAFSVDSILKNGVQ
ncbi:hypothetical protein GCM10023156_23720 [Novipirellula rosea]|uniref:Uncharacterized protein n=2 Tax=Novipirellula rosea TaxID=1031540 RepID=A0ABP8MQG0_9BACT